MRIAIVGTGIAGLTCAHLLGYRHDVTVFEKDHRPGGHANTVTVNIGGERHDVDTGFIVFNQQNYPGLVRLFRRLGVPVKPSEMSFSVSDEISGLEWRGTSPQTVFAQSKNLVRPEFLKMLKGVGSFNRTVRRLLYEGMTDSLTLGELVEQGDWSPKVVDWYLKPIVSAIWSAPPSRALDMPAHTFARFFENHGLLRLGAQPQWSTVDGGARIYVEKILAPLGNRVRLGTSVTKVTRIAGGVEILSAGRGPETFDHVILACHSDQALSLLGDPSQAEREILGSIRYQPNAAILHTDATYLPKAPRARASWNYRLSGTSERATPTYHLNRLQSIDSQHEICVTLNPVVPIPEQHVIGNFEYAHPILDFGATRAQKRYSEISGHQSTSYCGAYWGYGFHEDGLQSALRVCREFGGVL